MSKKIQQLRYPSDLASITDNYLLLQVKSFDAYSANTIGDVSEFKFSGDVSSQIALPIPVGLLDEVTTGWMDEKQANLLQSLLNKGMDNAIAKQVASASNHFGEKVSVLQYSSSTPRVYTLSWEFLPQNATEAETVEEIIKTLRRCQLHKKGVDIGGVVGSALYPDMLKVDIKGPAGRHHKFLPCFIQNLQVDRSFDDAFIFYKDGNVPSIKLSMPIIEISNLDRDIFDNMMSKGTI